MPDRPDALLYLPAYCAGCSTYIGSWGLLGRPECGRNRDIMSLLSCINEKVVWGSFLANAMSIVNCSTRLCGLSISSHTQRCLGSPELCSSANSCYARPSLLTTVVVVSPTLLPHERLNLCQCVIHMEHDKINNDNAVRFVAGTVY
jgi:hypothetical protein